MADFHFVQGPVWTAFADPDRDKRMTVAKVSCVPDPDRAANPSFSQGLWDGMTHFFDKQASRLPSGLLPRVVQRLRNRGHAVTVAREEDWPAGVPPVAPDCLEGIDLRDYQLAGVNAVLEARAGILWYATNAGKGACVAAVCGQLVRAGGRSGIIVVPNKTTLKVLSEDLRRYLGRGVSVGLLGDGHRDFKGRQVVVGTYQSWRKCVRLEGSFAKGGRWVVPAYDEALSAFVAAAGWVLLDEVHHCASPVHQAILKQCACAWWRVGFTGTVDKATRSDGAGAAEVASRDKARLHRWEMEQFIGPVLARVTNEELIERGVSAKPRVVVLDDRAAFGPQVVNPVGPMGDDGRREPPVNAYGTVFRRAAIEDERWLRNIRRCVRLLLAAGKPPFVFTHSVAHLQAILRVCQEGGVPFRILHGAHDSAQRARVVAAFKERQDFAVGASSIFNEGASIPEIRSIVLAGARKAPTELLQQIGRAIRAKADDNTTIVVDFVPSHSEMLTKHSRERMAVYRAEGFDTTVVTDRHRLTEYLT